MTALKKKVLNSSSSSYDYLYLNPLMDKENIAPSHTSAAVGCFVSSKGKKVPSTTEKSQQSKITLKPSSLQLCIRLNEPESFLETSKPWDPLPSSSDIWDFSDTDAAPASSWSALPNRSLLLRPLPLDVGRCTCIISKELMDGISCYVLYTNEGHGRQDRKLVVARHTRKRNGRSEFIIAQNFKGIFCSSDESFLGTITSNLMGSKYQIWQQGRKLDSMKSQSFLLGVVAFVPTITTLAGSFRSMRVCIPKQKSMQTKTTNKTTQIQHINGLPNDWEEKKNIADQLFSRVPYYNNITKRYELDFREKTGRTSSRIQTSAKNFQLTMEKNERQTVLQLGRVEKSKYVIDYRYPLTGYQAFCICLASIDSKLCCSI
ncbi:hypothetical protein IEQ34_020887 [Dendrobium chrysotoxum]|uniref:Tubby C-terminal domain-containing protein n=1 Tax=Dendrobium chrysotoxum TaxID=161865 RepID=A0AAV7FKQ0_DENCH|nr:hypothetical protein IEQ34_020887 [Dendrobium chrysotoxum]